MDHRTEVEWLDGNRLKISNNLMALEFSRKTSDSTWNYVWLHNGTSKTWHRSYNFGIDMIPREFPGVFISETLRFDVQNGPEGCHAKVYYGTPLKLYKNRRFTYSGQVMVDYFLPHGKPYFDSQVHIESGDYSYVIQIINSLWVENPELPKKILVPGQQVYSAQDITIPVHKMSHIMFYSIANRVSPVVFGFSEDNGFVRAKYGFPNYLPGHVYRQYALGQDYIPNAHYIDGYNDICYQLAPELSVREQQVLPRVRIAFLPFQDFSDVRPGGGDEISLISAKLYELNKRYSIFA